MASKMIFNLFSLTFLVLCMAKPSFEQKIFDPMDYEAEGDGVTDDSQALVDAWDSACEWRRPAIFVIPNRTFLAGPATFEGPCRVTPKVRILGRLVAPKSLSGFYNPGWIEFKRLDNLEISGGGTLDGQGAESWKRTSCPAKVKCKNLPMSLRLLKVNRSSISDLTFLNSKGFHISIQQSSSIAVTRLRIRAPADSPNTDGIHISNSDNIRIRGLRIGTGDDCISIGAGSTNVLIQGVACGPGHGISVGSLGKYPNEADVSGVRVKSCKILGATNGVRIKTWPGSPPSQASDFTFEDIIMRNVSNPIIIDQQYCPVSQCTSAPSQVKIKNVAFRRIKGTTSDPEAVQLNCSPIVPCENVQLQDISLSMADSKVASKPKRTITSICANVKGSASGFQLPKPCI